VREASIELAGLRAVVVEPDDPVAHVVLCHGFSMTPADLAPFAHSLGVPARFVFPEGPVAAELEPGVVRGRAWWHIDPVERARSMAAGPRDFAGLHPPDLPAARAGLGALIDEVAAGAAGRPVVVGGFSSGGMLAYDTVLRARRPLAGLVLLSATRIAADEEAAHVAARPLAGLPALLSHGRADDDLAFAAGEALRDAVTSAGADVTWVPFEQGHEIPLVVWRRLRRWLVQVAAPPAVGAPV
jgi:phospholipase/carboxylesterase